MKFFIAWVSCLSQSVPHLFTHSQQKSSVDFSKFVSEGSSFFWKKNIFTLSENSNLIWSRCYPTFLFDFWLSHFLASILKKVSRILIDFAEAWSSLAFKRWAIPGLFFFSFVFSIVQLVDKIMQMSGFELRISGVGSDCSTNWTTTTAQELFSLTGEEGSVSAHP